MQSIGLALRDDIEVLGELGAAGNFLDEVLLDVLVLDVVLLVVLDPHSLQHDVLPLLLGLDALPFEDLAHREIAILHLLLVLGGCDRMLGVRWDP